MARTRIVYSLASVKLLLFLNNESCLILNVRLPRYKDFSASRFRFFGHVVKDLQSVGHIMKHLNRLFTLWTVYSPTAEMTYGSRLGFH